ncbi:hypothetical protein NPS29_05305 [Pseudomonas putida]|uniref:hypothetical protein n=1 Tax=Pseudomonas putida TaxID=303 RepID=UPI00236388F7|nr:hypothetical protein [Pseudomonas putida]MDD1964726.1 hypothetical protein [Pseudomonas putida]
MTRGSGQVIGYLRGAQQAEAIGLSLISGAGLLDVRAQQDERRCKKRQAKDSSPLLRLQIELSDSC